MWITRQGVPKMTQTCRYGENMARFPVFLELPIKMEKDHHDNGRLDGFRHECIQTQQEEEFDKQIDGFGQAHLAR